MTELLPVSLIVLMINIPFGYWRANVRTFSLQWFLAIHIPVPFIIGLRLISSIGFGWLTYVFLVAAFFLGQKAGFFIFKKNRPHLPASIFCNPELFSSYSLLILKYIHH